MGAGGASQAPRGGFEDRFMGLAGKGTIGGRPGFCKFDPPQVSRKEADNPMGWGLHAQPGRGYGAVVSPGPSASCMSTVSTQRPCLWPMEGSAPTRRKPHAVCNAMEGLLRLSPITASSCR